MWSDTYVVGHDESLMHDVIHILYDVTDCFQCFLHSSSLLHRYTQAWQFLHDTSRRYFAMIQHSYQQISLSPIPSADSVVQLVFQSELIHIPKAHALRDNLRRIFYRLYSDHCFLASPLSIASWRAECYANVTWIFLLMVPWWPIISTCTGPIFIKFPG